MIPDPVPNLQVNRSACYTLILVVPTRFNPPPGLRHGRLIPYFRVRRILAEFAMLTGGYHLDHIERITGHVRASVVDGVWLEPDATAPDGSRRYVDPDAIELSATVVASEAQRVLDELLERAEGWADELDQVAMYLEAHGMGYSWQFLVRVRVAKDRGA